MGKQESVLKSALMQTIKAQLPDFIAIRHEDVRTSGTPDISLTGLRRTAWIEVKHGTPRFESTGIQELTMLRLARAGFARYLIYQEDKNGESRRTLIVHPRNLGSLTPEASCEGFNHRWVVEYFREAHRP